MRSHFPGYYRRTEEELRRIWEDGFFVLDANVLLNLYRYSEGTRNELLQVLRGVKDRLWIPHQVADEFLRNRQTVIRERKGAYSAVRRSLSDAHKDVEKKMGEMHVDPGIIEAKDLRKRIKDSFSKLIAEAEKLENEAAIQSIQETDSPEDDEIWWAVSDILEGRIGEGLLPSRMQKVLEMGPRRYESRVPPGFNDQNDKIKPGDRQFGDLLLWFEILDEAKDTGRPVLFVTDDRKADWWSNSGRNLYPHPDLGNEMYREAEVLFHMFVPLDFVKWAGSKLDQEISDEAADEIEELRSLDETMESIDFDLLDLLFNQDLGREIDVDDLKQISQSDLDALSRKLERVLRYGEEDPDGLLHKIKSLRELSDADPIENLERFQRLLRQIRSRFDY